MFRSFIKRKYNLPYETVCLKFSLLLINFFNTNSCGVWCVVISSSSLAETVKYFETFRTFRQIMYDDFPYLSVFQIMYENYHYEQLVKIRTFVNYPMIFIDSFCRNTFCCCISQNVNARNYHGDSLNVLFPRFNFFLHFI